MYVEFRKLTRQCADCRRDFVAIVPVDRTGQEHLEKAMDVCDPCWEVRRKNAALTKLSAEADRVGRERRAKWMATLPPKAQRYTFASFEAGLQPEAFGAMHAFRIEDGKSLVLLSPNIYRVGKTHLSCALAQRIFEDTAPVTINSNAEAVRLTPLPVIFTTETAMLNRIRATFDRPGPPVEGQETEASVYRELERVPLLIIDDVGKVRPREMNFLQGVYFEIIDTRYMNDRPVIMTANLDSDELELHLGGATSKRLFEMCGGEPGLIVMTGESYWPQSRKAAQ